MPMSSRPICLDAEQRARRRRERDVRARLLGLVLDRHADAGVHLGDGPHAVELEPPELARSRPGRGSRSRPGRARASRSARRAAWRRRRPPRRSRARGGGRPGRGWSNAPPRELAHVDVRRDRASAARPAASQRPPTSSTVMSGSRERIVDVEHLEVTDVAGALDRLERADLRPVRVGRVAIDELPEQPEPGSEPHVALLLSAAYLFTTECRRLDV